MNFLKFSQRPKEQESSDGEVPAVDILYLVTYMSAVAAAGVSRGKLLELASDLPCRSARYLKKVYLTVQGLSYDYGTACRMVGEATRVEAMKSLLLRLASALSSGEMGASFLEGEAHIQGRVYENEYERDVESMRKWTDAYAALTVSVTLVVIINLISTLIYESSDTSTIAITFVALLIGMAGSWIISRSAPKELTNFSSSEGSREQELSGKMLKTLLPLALLVCLCLALLRAKLGWLFIAGGVLVFPVGLVSFLGDARIIRKEGEIGSFFRTIGGLATAVGTTLAEAVTRIDLRSLVALKPDVKELRLRILGFIDFNLCWKKFTAETGSALIGQSGGIFLDAVNMGGDPEREGFLCSLFASRVSMLRAKRGTVSSTFLWLSLVMHFVVMALMVFIMEIIVGFQAILQEKGVGLSADLPLPIFTFGSSNTDILYTMTKITMFLLTVTTALALSACKGGNRKTFLYFFGILMIISGLTLLSVPGLANTMFQSTGR